MFTNLRATIRRSGGRWFYRIMWSLLAIVLVIVLSNAILFSCLRQESIDAQVNMLSTAIENGSRLMDDFFLSSIALSASLNNSNSIVQLNTASVLSLSTIVTAQRELSAQLSSYVSSGKYSSEAFVYFYDQDSLITNGNSVAGGLTNLKTWFNNRFSGDPDAFRTLLKKRHTSSIMLWPFPILERQNSYQLKGQLCILQTLYVNARAIGTLAISLNDAKLADEMEHYLVVPESRAGLILNGEVLSAKLTELNVDLPEGRYTGYIPGTGVVVRQPSKIFSTLEYLIVLPEGAIMSDHTRSIAMANYILIITAALLAAAAVLISRWLYRPIRRVMNELQKDLTPHSDEEELLLCFIRESNQESSDMHSSVIRDALLHHLLCSNGREDKLLMDQFLPATACEGNYYVFVAVLVPGEVSDESWDNPNQPLAQLQADIQQDLLATVQTDESEFTMITQSLNEEQYAACCNALAQACRQLSEAYPNALILTAADEGVRHIDRIAFGYRQAQQMLMKRPVTFGNGLLKAADIVPEKSINLPMNMESTLITLIGNRQEAEIWGYIENILRGSREQAITMQSYVKIAYDMNDVFLRFANAQPASFAIREQLIAFEPGRLLLRPEQIDAILRDNLHILVSGVVPPIGDMEKIKEYMDHNFASDPSLSDAAEHFGYSPSYFSRYFKQHMGVNYSDYLTQLKIASACQALKDGNKSVREVGEACGFGNTSGFIAAFSRLVGVTPGNYKKQVRQ